MKNSLFGLLLLTLVSCTTAPFPDGLSDARVGMDKAAVLNLGGNPTHTYHEKGQDHWIYEYKKDDEHLVRQLTFQDGLVVIVGPTYVKKVTTNAAPAEDSEDLEHFEKKMREEAKPKGEFKDIP